MRTGHRESTLHQQLKQLYAGDDGAVEVPLNGYIADVVRNGVVYEVQTGGFSALRGKLEVLATEYPITLVHPVARERVIVRKQSPCGAEISRRRSPKRGDLSDIFAQTVYVASLLAHPNVALEVVLTREEQIRIDNGMGSWRRHGVSLCDRILLGIDEIHRFVNLSDYLRLLPPDLPEEFAVPDISRATGHSVARARQIAYSLREMGAISMIGKRGNAKLYRVCQRQFA